MRFTEQNTQGYSTSDLAELNRRYSRMVANLNPDDLNHKSTCDAIAERILREYDDEIAPPAK